MDAAEAIEQLALIVAASNIEALPPSDAAKFIGISTSKFFELDRDALIPQPVQLGERLPRWSRTELRQWLIAGAPPRRRWNEIKGTQMKGASL